MGGMKFEDLDLGGAGSMTPPAFIIQIHNLQRGGLIEAALPRDRYSTRDWNYTR